MARSRFIGGLALACLAVSCIAAPAWAMASRVAFDGVGPPMLDPRALAWGLGLLSLAFAFSYRRFGATVALGTILVLSAGAHAYAADSTSTVSLRPLIEPALGLLGALLMALGLWVAQRVAAWAGVAIDGERREALAMALEKAVAYGINRVSAATAGQPLTVPIAIPVLAEALNRLLPSVPDALAHFNVTPERAVRLLISRLPNVEGAITDGDIDKIIAIAKVRPPA